MFITENIPATASVTFMLDTMYKTADHFVAASFICVVADRWLRVERAYGSSRGQCSAATSYALLRAVWPSAEGITSQNEIDGLAWIHATSAVSYVQRELLC